MLVLARTDFPKGFEREPSLESFAFRGYPQILAILQNEDGDESNGVLLSYFADKQMREEIKDTWYCSAEDAIEAAREIYGIRCSSWVFYDPPKSC